MERGSQKKQVEMNRRPKFLTIEGIQKRKNPDKNYVSVLVFSFQLDLLFLIFNLPRIINESARKCFGLFFSAGFVIFNL